MRIVASACLVIAILFMVGCGTSAEDKKMITEQGAKITTLEKTVGDMGKATMDMAKKLTDVETFLKGKFKDYGAPDSTKTTTTTTTTKTTKTSTPPPTTPPTTPPTKAPAKAKEPGKTK